MKYIVTGGAGFIGSHLAETLSLQGHEVFIIDNLSSGKIDNIAHLIETNDVTFVKGSITDLELLQEQCAGADGIFHQAALVSVPKSIEDPLLNHTVNSTGTLNVLLAARDAGVRKVVFASSAAVYGNLPGLPKREDMAVDPQSPYAVAKLTGEYYCVLFSRLYGVKGGRPPVIYGDGDQTRDFIYVTDVVRMNLRAMESKAEGVLNVASGKETSVNELAHTILSLKKTSLKPIYEKGREGEVKHSVADIGKAIEHFGIAPEYDLSQGLSEMVSGMI
jgi:nucleoside-diphosphate-sugar epimerase